MGLRATSWLYERYFRRVDAVLVLSGIPRSASLIISMPLAAKPILKFEVHIEDKIVDVLADTVEIYEAGVPTFYKNNKIIAAFNEYSYFIQVDTPNAKETPS